MGALLREHRYAALSSGTWTFFPCCLNSGLWQWSFPAALPACLLLTPSQMPGEGAAGGSPWCLVGAPSCSGWSGFEVMESLDSAVSGAPSVTCPRSSWARQLHAVAGAAAWPVPAPRSPMRVSSSSGLWPARGSTPWRLWRARAHARSHVPGGSGPACRQEQVEQRPRLLGWALASRGQRGPSLSPCWSPGPPSALGSWSSCWKVPGREPSEGAAQKPSCHPALSLCPQTPCRGAGTWLLSPRESRARTASSSPGLCSRVKPVRKNLLEAEPHQQGPRLGHPQVFLTWGESEASICPPEAPQSLDLGGGHAGGQLSLQSL